MPETFSALDCNLVAKTKIHEFFGEKLPSSFKINKLRKQSRKVIEIFRDKASVSDNARDLDLTQSPQSFASSLRDQKANRTDKLDHSLSAGRREKRGGSAQAPRCRERGS